MNENITNLNNNDKKKITLMDDFELLSNDISSYLTTNIF